jgi:hypothetical protein
MTTKGWIEHHYKLFGGITIIFVEVQVKIGDTQERWNVIAQVIAESDGKHSNASPPFLIESS